MTKRHGFTLIELLVVIAIIFADGHAKWFSGTAAYATGPNFTWYVH